MSCSPLPIELAALLEPWLAAPDAAARDLLLEQGVPGPAEAHAWAAILQELAQGGPAYGLALEGEAALARELALDATLLDLATRLAARAGEESLRARCEEALKDLLADPLVEGFRRTGPGALSARAE